ncbi:Uncharacterised protein [Mycobacterium tuberculosis]|nr:Uncharacterised protein [Mycobacterium tuberculosis]
MAAWSMNMPIDRKRFMFGSAMLVSTSMPVARPKCFRSSER